MVLDWGGSRAGAWFGCNGGTSADSSVLPYGIGTVLNVLASFVVPPHDGLSFVSSLCGFTLVARLCCFKRPGMPYIYSINPAAISQLWLISSTATLFYRHNPPVMPMQTSPSIDTDPGHIVTVRTPHFVPLFDYIDASSRSSLDGFDH